MIEACLWLLGVFTTCSLSTIETDEYTSESWSEMTSAFKTSHQVRYFRHFRAVLLYHNCFLVPRTCLFGRGVSKADLTLDDLGMQGDPQIGAP